MSMFFRKKKNTKSFNYSQTLISCRICGRNFANDRIDTHEQVCQRVFQKKRPVFDSAPYRLRGVVDDQQGPIRKSPRNKQQSIKSKKLSTKASDFGGGQGGNGHDGHDCCGHKRTNWRQIHKEFITNIRNARMVQSHLAQGGKLSDLPPVQPSVNPDYIQCPHCLRRFNETAGNRHIPQCANYQHNKPRK